MNRAIFLLFALAVACNTGSGSSEENDGSDSPDETAGSGSSEENDGSDSSEGKDAGGYAQNDANFGSDAGCDELEDGRYHALYERIDGSCEETALYSIPIEYKYSQVGKFAFEETNFNYEQLTEITYQGCALEIVYQVKANNTLIFHLQGSFEVDDTTRLSGKAIRIEYNNEDGKETCRGTYEVEMMKTSGLT